MWRSGPEKLVILVFFIQEIMDLFSVFNENPDNEKEESKSPDNADSQSAADPAKNQLAKKSKGSRRRERKRQERESKELDDTPQEESIASLEARIAALQSENSGSTAEIKKLQKELAKLKNSDSESKENKSSEPQSSQQSKEPEPPAKRQKKQDDQIMPVVTDAVEVTAEQPSTAADAAGDIEVIQPGRHMIRHEVALPPNYDYTPIENHKSVNPARTYPFTLDPFQSMSIAAIERGESVLVSAHTSAGKTVVAEYAIAQALRSKQRVVYTSPIKALSNQKYRELLADFGDVGLMTGDITLNPDASCLVMTTEILRSMLYRGSEVVRELSWIIFDEVHYMRDKERGVVWEEALILLPDRVRCVFLSATIPNAREFAEWITQIHHQPCHVVYTNFRPTPLQHYLFPEGGSGIHLVVDEKGNFREENFQKAMSALNAKAGEDPGNPNAKSKNGKLAKGGKKDLPDIYKIIKMIMLKNFNPVIVFSFSKRECESLAMKMAKLDFNNSDEHDMVTKVFENAMSQLSDSDRELTQIKSIFPLLKRGIGVHHSGLLPILKEVIELLFQEGLIKVLFATETFSIGLNMPAKTVVFTSVRKFDGKETRWVSGGEYIQMSGRAGRRGLDDRGLVIMMINEQMDPNIAKGMVKGVADRLDSAFHLGYNMILNLLRVEGISPEYMLEHCFYQFQHATKVPKLEEKQLLLENKFAETKVEDEEAIAEYYNLQKKIEEYGEQIVKIVLHPGNSLSFLVKGRLIYVKVELPDKEPLDFGWGVVTGVDSRKQGKNNKVIWDDHEKYIVQVLVSVSKLTPMHLVRKFDPKLVPGVAPPKDGEASKAEILPITLNSIKKISSIRTHIPPDLSSSKQRTTVMRQVEEIKKRFPDGIPPLDPIENMHIQDEGLTDLVKKVNVLESKLAENTLTTDDRLQTLYDEYQAKMDIQKQIVAVKDEIKDANAIIQMDELKNRKRVLRKLGFTTPDDIVELKGRVACEISSGDELLLTELMFNGTFTKLTPEQCVALLSCFVFDEKVNDQSSVLNPDLKEPYRVLNNMAQHIAKVSIECKIPLVESEYVESFKPQLMDVVYQWAKGCTFSQIMQMTEVFEGSLVRMFRRLEELLRQLAQAARTIGSEELADKMEKGLELIHRGLVNSPSLYL